jgi:hypothetical protein
VRARETHDRLVAQTLGQIQAVAQRSQEEQSRLEAQRSAERERGTYCGRRGHGKCTKRIAAELLAAQRHGVEPAAELALVRQALDYPVDGLSAAAIFQKDHEAWSKLPPKYQQGTEPLRHRYVDETMGISLLAPYHRLVAKRDASVSAALYIALFLDGMCLMLGTALEVRRRKTLIQLLVGLANGLIWQIKNARATILETLRRPGHPDTLGPLGQETELEASVRIVELQLQGRTSEFLQSFHLAIDERTRMLDQKKFEVHHNWTFRYAARALRDAMRSPQVGWLVQEKDEMMVPAASYFQATRWLREEIVRQMEIEKKQDPAEAKDTVLHRVRLVLGGTAAEA